MNLEEWKSQKEQEVLELKNLWESGGISESEYKELVEDITHCKNTIPIRQPRLKKQSSKNY